MEHNDLDLAPAGWLAKGWAALRERQMAQALQAFALARVLAPDEVDGCVGLATALRESRRGDLAIPLLQEARLRHPEHEQLGVVLGWCHFALEAWDDAARVFRQVRQQWPASPGAWHGLCATLVHMGQYEEAERVLSSRPVPEGRFGQDILDLMARLAGRMGRSDLAIGRWQQAVDRDPQDRRLHLALLNACREAGRGDLVDETIQQVLQRFGDDLELMRLLAQNAQQAEDWSAALQRWEAVKTLFPSVTDGYVGCAGALRAMDRPEDAELVIAPALRMFPSDVPLLRLAAEVATEARRHGEAERRWHALQELCPQDPSVFIGEVQTHLDFGLGTSAESKSTALQSRFPDDPWVAMLHARVAGARQDLEAALERWQSVVERFPALVPARLGLIDALADVEQREAAEAMLDALVAERPDDIDVLTAQARMPMRWKQWDRAEARWQQVLDKAPGHLPALLDYALLLNTVEEHGMARSLLQTARVPPAARLILDIELARISVAVRDWPLAFRQLESLKRRRPWNRALKHLIADALWQARQDEVVQAGAMPPVPELLLRTDDDDARDRQARRRMLICFESLGDSCEFGMVQRRFGAEPLSLLRWTSTAPDALAEALTNRLEGVGDPAQTQLELAPQGNEYVVRDLRYGMFSHTFTPSFAQPFDEFHAAHCKRLRFMRNKLLDDFANSAKVFVYASAQLDDGAIAQLHLAARSLGPEVVLLCVRQADDAHPPGEVQELVPGLLVAGLSAFSTVNIALDEWLQICEQALVLCGRMGEIA